MSTCADVAAEGGATGLAGPRFVDIVRGDEVGHVESESVLI